MFSIALLLLLAAGSCVNSIDLIQPDSMVVQPGQSVTISCQVSGFSVTDSSYATGWIRHCEGKPMDWIFYQWGESSGNFYQNNALKNKFSYSRDTSAGTLTLNVQNVQPEDTAVYYCVRYSWGGYYFDYWGKGTTVTVTSASPTAPTVFPLIQCGSGTGGLVTLGCLATGFTPSSVTYSWTKNGATLNDFIQYPPVLKDNVYSGISQISVSEQDWATKTNKFLCTASNAGGSKEAEFNIPEPPRAKLPDILRVSASYDEGTEATILCFAKDFSPKASTIKWLKNDEDFNNKVDEIITTSEKSSPNGTLYSRVNSLIVSAKDWTPDTKFTCLFEGKDKSMNSSVEYQRGIPIDNPCTHADVEITIIEPSMEDMFLRGKGQLVCQVHVNRPTIDRIWWEDEKKNEMRSPEKVKVSDKLFTRALDITYEEWRQGIKRICFVEHSEFLDPVQKSYQRNIGGQPQRPAVFMLPPLEQTAKQMVTLTCFVKDFFPKEVYVSWLVNDDTADSANFRTTKPVEKSGSYSAYGQLSITLDQWEKQRDAVYSCVVYHEAVANSTKAIVRSTGFRSSENTNLVNLNMNIPDACKAQ